MTFWLKGKRKSRLVILEGRCGTTIVLKNWKVRVCVGWIWRGIGPSGGLL
jgi:hypothetical protein